MPDDKNNFNPIDAIRYHFTEFNVWMGFFVVISGGLLVAYSNQNLDSLEKVLIPLVGYTTTFLCHCLSICYCRCVTRLSEIIDDSFKQEDEKYFPPLKYAKISTTRIISLLTFILTYPWGILLTVKVNKYMEITLLSYRLVNVISGIVVTTIINLLSRLFVDKCLLCDIANYVKLKSK